MPKQHGESLFYSGLCYTQAIVKEISMIDGIIIVLSVILHMCYPNHFIHWNSHNPWENLMMSALLLSCCYGR